MNNINFTILTIVVFLMWTSCNEKPTSPYLLGISNCNMIKDMVNNGDKSLIKFYAKPLCIVGYQMPEFLAHTINGKSIDINYFKGKITILNFWFSNCQPCVAEIPGFNNIVQKYGIVIVNYLGICLDQAHDVDTFLQNHKWSFEQIGDGENLIKNIFKIEWGFPTTFIIDTNAKIIDAFSGGRVDNLAVDELVNRIESRLDKENMN